jgi:hypothetical protein
MRAGQRYTRTLTPACRRLWPAMPTHGDAGWGKGWSGRADGVCTWNFLWASTTGLLAGLGEKLDAPHQLLLMSMVPLPLSSIVEVVVFSTRCMAHRMVAGSMAWPLLMPLTVMLVENADWKRSKTAIKKLANSSIFAGGVGTLEVVLSNRDWKTGQVRGTNNSFLRSLAFLYIH